MMPPTQRASRVFNAPERRRAPAPQCRYNDRPCPPQQGFGAPFGPNNYNRRPRYGPYPEERNGYYPARRPEQFYNERQYMERGRGGFDRYGDIYSSGPIDILRDWLRDPRVLYFLAINCLVSFPLAHDLTKQLMKDPSILYPAEAVAACFLIGVPIIRQARYIDPKTLKLLAGAFFLSIPTSAYIAVKMNSGQPYQYAIAVAILAGIPVFFQNRNRNQMYDRY